MFVPGRIKPLVGAVTGTTYGVVVVGGLINVKLCPNTVVPANASKRIKPIQHRRIELAVACLQTMVRLKIFIVSLSRSKKPWRRFEFGQAHPLIETWASNFPEALGIQQFWLLRPARPAKEDLKLCSKSHPDKNERNIGFED